MPHTRTTLLAGLFRARPLVRWLKGWRLTSEGLLWLLTVALLLGIGIVKNINLLALLGYVMLVVLLLNALAAGLRLRRLEAHRHVEEVIFAGSSCKVAVRLRNLDGRPRHGFRLEDAGPAHSLAWYLPHLDGQGRITVSGEVVLPRRGFYDFGPVIASSGHPFGLIRRRVAVSEPLRVVAAPLLGKLSRDQLRQRLRGADPHADRVHRHGWRHEAAQADFHGLRPFRPGDSPRWIHWRTSARRSELMVREMEDVPGDDLVLLLDQAAPAGDLFEEAVALTATIVWEWCRRRGDRLILMLGDEVLDGLTEPEHARRLLERLAVVEAGQPDHASALVDRCLAAPLTAGVIVVFAGPSALAEALEGGLTRPAMLLDVARREEWGFYSRIRNAE